MNVCFPLFIPSIINYDLKKKPFILLHLAVLRLLQFSSKVCVCVLQFYFLQFMGQNKERDCAREQERKESMMLQFDDLFLFALDFSFWQFQIIYERIERGQFKQQF